MKNIDLQFHDTLNPKLWDGDVLKEKVKSSLVKIGNAFVKFLKIDVNVEDMLFLGSNANYNYTEYSDIDLHIVIDFSKVNKDKKLVKELVDSKKYVWNKEHNIKIKGYKVECYVQDISEVNASTAIYSLKTDEWIKKPKVEHPKVDSKEVLLKSKDFIKRIEMSKDDLDSLKVLKDKLKTMRKAGLEKGGEFSTENLVFKALRNSKNIEKLVNYAKELYDKELSLKELYEEDFNSILKEAPFKNNYSISYLINILDKNGRKFARTKKFLIDNKNKIKMDKNVNILLSYFDFIKSLPNEIGNLSRYTTAHSLSYLVIDWLEVLMFYFLFEEKFKTVRESYFMDAITEMNAVLVPLFGEIDKDIELIKTFIDAANRREGKVRNAEIILGIYFKKEIIFLGGDGQNHRYKPLKN